MIVFLFIGFPASWDRAFAIVMGVIVLVVGLKDSTRVNVRHDQSVPYSEHKNGLNIKIRQDVSMQDIYPVSAVSKEQVTSVDENKIPS